MNKFDNNILLSENRNPFLSFLIILFSVLFGFFIVGPFLGFIIAIPFIDGGLTELESMLMNPMSNPAMKVPLFIVQGFATLIGLILVPYLYLRNVEHKPINAFFSQKLTLVSIVVTGLVVMTFMMFNSIFIDWNAGISFPEFLKGFENWAREKEDLAAKMTGYLTTFDTTGQFVLAFVVIAILPAIGEELVFRGLIQNELHGASRNIHLAIWLSAILFSAIHMQFFGFIPRMLLGALFGYLYHWSGNLFVPIFAHFVNNGFTLVMVHLHNLGRIEVDIENTETAPLSTVLIFTIITALLLYFFRNYSLKVRSVVNE